MSHPHQQEATTPHRQRRSRERIVYSVSGAQLRSRTQLRSRAQLHSRVVFSVSGYIDCDRSEEKALDFRPKMIICGGNAYPRDWDYKRFRDIADKRVALLLCDMAHISGFVDAKTLHVMILKMK